MPEPYNAAARINEAREELEFREQKQAELAAAERQRVQTEQLKVDRLYSDICSLLAHSVRELEKMPNAITCVVKVTKEIRHHGKTLIFRDHKEWSDYHMTRYLARWIVLNRWTHSDTETGEGISTGPVGMLQLLEPGPGFAAFSSYGDAGREATVSISSMTREADAEFWAFASLEEMARWLARSREFSHYFSIYHQGIAAIELGVARALRFASTGQAPSEY